MCCWYSVMCGTIGGISQTWVRRIRQTSGRVGAKGVNDLVIAAAAELTGLTLLHYDHDFDLIAEVTGQPTEWVVPRGTVP